MAARKKTKARRSRADAEFVSEAEEVLERLREDLVELYEQPDGEDVPPELVNRMFRSAHSLKGLAGMFGFEGIGELSHRLEDVLDGMRMGRIAMSRPAVELVEEVVALFAALLSVGPEDERDELDSLVAAMTERLVAAAQATQEAGALESIELDESVLRALTEYEEHRLRTNLARGRAIALLHASFEILAFEEGLTDLIAAVREVGEVLSTLPSPGESAESEIRFALLVATELDVAALVESLDFEGLSADCVAEASSEAGTARGADSPGSAEAVPDAGEREVVDLESLRSISETVRVDIRKLDELMMLVGELGIQRGAITRLASDLSSDSVTRRAGVELGKINGQLERRIKELQAGVLDVRMVPLRQIFQKLSRVVRRLQRDLGRDVELEFKGADTELDKLMVEELVDPLMHIVRNALDHAIEPSADRSAQGKAPIGTIRVEASQRGNHVVIEVSDDGRGVDPALIRQKAIERGLLTEDEVLTDNECLDLLFVPGFSTREIVSETSGRGVGMDVVRSNMASLGGVVDFRSIPGSGSVVTLTLPITLAIVQALLVRAGDQRFAIPLNSVLETLEVANADIQQSEGRKLLNLRGEALPLRRLADEFEIATEGSDQSYAVVLGIGEARLGLLVDQLDGQQDAVIKPIRGPVRHIRGIAGATELGDGTAVLVLDVASVVEDSARRREVA